MPLLFRVFLGLFGLVFIGGALWLRNMSARASGWPAVEGEVTKSLLETEHLANTASASIAYRFTVDGHEYEASQFSFAVQSAMLVHAKRLLVEYPVGRKVQVHYDPSNPSSAVIQTGPSGWKLFAASGAVFVAAGLLFP